MHNLINMILFYKFEMLKIEEKEVVPELGLIDNIILLKI